MVRYDESRKAKFRKTQDFIDLIVFIDCLKRQDFGILDCIPKV